MKHAAVVTMPVRNVMLALSILAVLSQMPASATDVEPPAGASSRSTQPMAGSGGTIELPKLADDNAREYPGLHNVVAFHDGYLSGGVPEGDAGFDALLAMGVKTIISVDGAEPDVARAKARGIRYIHLPIGYNGFDETRKLELVRASRDAARDGPVYVHCHHGKHRSAGAAGTVAASLGWLTPEKAIERMKVSGTAPNYKGLYACTACATVLDAAAIDAVPGDFPEVSKPATFVKSMVEIDEINDRLKLIEKAGWKTPDTHPDLVPAAEAGRMADLFRLLMESDKVKAHEPDFIAAMRLNGQQAQTLEDMLVNGRKEAREMSAVFRLMQNSCKACHVAYRD